MNSIPIENLYVLDIPNSITSHRIITDKTTFASRKFEDLPLSDADGYICVKPEEFGKFRVWLKGQKK